MKIKGPAYQSKLPQKQTIHFAPVSAKGQWNHLTDSDIEAIMQTDAGMRWFTKKMTSFRDKIDRQWEEKIKDIIEDQKTISFAKFTASAYGAFKAVFEALPEQDGRRGWQKSHISLREAVEAITVWVAEIGDNYSDDDIYVSGVFQDIRKNFGISIDFGNHTLRDRYHLEPAIPEEDDHIFDGMTLWEIWYWGFDLCDRHDRLLYSLGFLELCYQNNFSKNKALQLFEQLNEIMKNNDPDNALQVIRHSKSYGLKILDNVSDTLEEIEKMQRHYATKRRWAGKEDFKK